MRKHSRHFECGSSTILSQLASSKTINAFFEQLVDTVIAHGGDVLEFAGDAFFAEWRPVKDDLSSHNDSSSDEKTFEMNRHDYRGNFAFDNHALKKLNASISSSGELSYGGHSDLIDTSDIARCVLLAAKCASSIVQKFSDYQISSRNDTAILNVHAGLGCGRMSFLHVGDYQGTDHALDGMDEAVELRREYLFLGDPINQVSCGFPTQQYATCFWYFCHDAH